jgi:PQQ-dependent dehydrogenase (s-GDH family)
MPLPPTWSTRAVASWLAIAACITACDDDDDSQSDAGTVDAAISLDAGVGSPDGQAEDRHDAAGAVDAAAKPDGSFAMRVVKRGLAAPWELAWGRDGLLWVTERTGKRVSRIDPSSGAQTVALELADAYQGASQDGLLGLALQPDSDYVYLAYTYDADASDAIDRRARIARYRYAPPSLVEPVVLLEDLPASTDHNAGRLVFGPDAALYYSIGDQGKNQFDLKCQPIRAQELPTQDEVDAHDWSKYQGKVLRLALDGGIPADNPLLAGVRSHVFTYGHRNAQGLAFTPSGLLFADEQGPKTDDELNLLLPGHNYGWPRVAGFRDDQAYVYGDWSAAADCADLAYSDYAFAGSVPVQTESSWSSVDFTPPLRTFYTVANDYNFMDPLCAQSPYICWPTIAPSSLDVYASDGIPGWSTSLLITSLKDGAVHRVQLRGAGLEDGDERLFETTNRYRDLALAPDGRTFYVATDSSGDTRAVDGSPTKALDHPGAILEFRYLP